MDGNDPSRIVLRQILFCILSAIALFVTSLIPTNLLLRFSGLLYLLSLGLMASLHWFYEGPLTLIFSIKKDSLPSIVTGGLSTAAFRMPNNTKTLALIKQAQQPLVGPSANTSGKPSPTSAAHVQHDLAGKIAGILDDLT